MIAQVAAKQQGVVTRKQLLADGIRAEQIRRRLEKGTLLTVHRGVYRVGHAAPSLLATYMAAVLACGPGALLAGRAAAHLYGLLKGPPAPPEALCPTQRKVPGIVTKRYRRLDPGHATEFRRIPATTVPRTLVDLAGVLSENRLALAVHEAGVRYDITPDHVEPILSTHPNTAGAAALRLVLHGDVRVTLSKLERRFLALLRETGLPLPETNRPAGGRRVDCRWPAQRLTVELDGYRYHRSRHAWELDRRREREAYARGDDFRRYTYADVFSQPRLMLRELHQLTRA